MQDFKHLDEVIIIPYESVQPGTVFRARKKFFIKRKYNLFPELVNQPQIYKKFRETDLCAVLAKHCVGVKERIIKDRFVVHDLAVQAPQ